MTYKSIFLYLGLTWLSMTGLQAQSNFKWGGYLHLNQGNISNIYEWRNYLCIEGCTSVGRQAAFSYEWGLMGQFFIQSKTRLELKIGYQNFSYIEQETYSDGANFFLRDTERNLEHLLLGVAVQQRLLTLGRDTRHLYISGGLQWLWNTQQEENFEVNSFAGTVRAWNSLAEVGGGITWHIGRLQFQTGPHFRIALNNFAKTKELINQDFDQLRPQEIGLRFVVLFP